MVIKCNVINIFIFICRRLFGLQSAHFRCKGTLFNKFLDSLMTSSLYNTLELVELVTKEENVELSLL